MDTNKPLYEWSDKELLERQRSYPSGIDPIHGWNIKAEIERRKSQMHKTYVMIAVIVVAIAVFGSMVAAITSWVTNYLAQHPGLI
jgi:hypothetical protein